MCEKREQPHASTASTIDRRVVFHRFLLLLLVSVFRFRAFIFPFRFLLFAFARPRRPRRDHHTPSPPVSLGPLGNKCFRISTSNRLSLSNATTTTRDPHRKKERKGPSAARASKRYFGISIDAARVRRNRDTITSGYVRSFVRRAKRQ